MTRRWKHKPTLMMTVVVALVALLGLLATLQYRWLGHVSEAERERMHTSLVSAVEQFKGAFDREITRAYLYFQMPGAKTRDQAAALFGEHYTRWTQAAPYPEIVGELFLFDGQPDKPGQEELYRFDRQVARFESVEWPVEFNPIRQRFQALARLRPRIPQERKVIVMGQVPRIAVPVTSSSYWIGALAEEVPALTLPMSFDAPAGAEDAGPFGSPNACAVLKLNQDYLNRQFIPTLVEKYFAANGLTDYHVTIVSQQDPKKVIYQSYSQSPGGPPADGDATAQILSIGVEDLTTVLPEGIANTFDPKPGLTERHGKFTIRLDSQTVRDGIHLTPISAAADSGGWRMILTHRSGSLDAAVAVIRFRNLAINAGVLLLLVGSIAMIVVSSRRAERLARQQMEFVAGVSHEFRTPLAVIRSAGENLADGVIADPSQVQRYGSLIESEGRRLTQMVEQVLEFAGIQSGRVTYDLRAANTSEVVKDALAASHALISESACEIEMAVPQTLPAIRVDAPALSRSIQNLLSNAIKYGGPRPWIRISAEFVVSNQRPEVLVRIEDRGVGIPSNDLSHVFEPFYRGRDAMAAQIHGNGLGLSIVKSILDAHGGKVSVASAVGKGSCFTLYLPSTAEAEPDRAGASDGVSDGGGPGLVRGI